LGKEILRIYKIKTLDLERVIKANDLKSKIMHAGIEDNSYLFFLP
jgi:hypothetical protein